MSTPAAVALVEVWHVDLRVNYRHGTEVFRGRVETVLPSRGALSSKDTAEIKAYQQVAHESPGARVVVLGSRLLRVVS